MRVAQVAAGERAGPAGLVFNLMRYALHDGPGIRTTVFFKGCPLSCWWCHNPESRRPQPQLMYFRDRCIGCGTCLAACPEHAIGRRDGGVTTTEACRVYGACEPACPADAREIVGRWMRVDDVLAEIEKDRIFYDESGGGVTFSGGEPLMQPEFLEALLLACRARGLHTTVDTCGMASPEILLRIAPVVDLFLFDLKLLDGEQHARYVGVPNDLILTNLELLARGAHPVIVRFPVIPGINDDAAHGARMISFLAGLGLRRIDLLPYHKIAQDKYHRLQLEYRLEGVEPPSEARMQELAACFERAGFAVRIGG